MKNKTLKLFVIALSTVALAGAIKAAPPVTVEDVGDVGSFGHPALYMGAASGFVTLSSDPCPAPSPSPNPGSQCFELTPAPTTTFFDAENICTIKLPKKATRTIIYPATNYFVSYQLQNLTGVPQPSGRFAFTARISVESAALLDPTVIDPATGLPANGKLESQFTYIYNDDRSMDVGDRHRQRMTLVRVGNAGINKAQLVAQGIPQAVVDAMFAGPMTLRMSINGSARLVTDANITGNMRLFGD